MSTPEDELPAMEPVEPMPPPEEPTPQDPPAEEPMEVLPPDGFEDRDRVSSSWRPRDVVYQASQDIGESAQTLFVCWIENGEIRFHSSGDNVAALIVGALGAYMGWR